MYDIDLDEKELELLIKELDMDNKNIVENINYLYNMMSQIDDNDWYSPEKDRLNDGYIPYLREQGLLANERLLAMTNILKKALADYRERNQSLKDETEQLEAFK